MRYTSHALHIDPFVHQPRNHRVCLILREFLLVYLNLRDPHDVEARLDLLLHEGLSRGHEDDLGEREPAEVVVHDHGGDEGLPEPRGKGDQCVVVQAGLDDPAGVDGANQYRPYCML